MRASEFVSEKWSQKYKRSINCANPKGFSQRAHCQGRKKHNEDVETKYQVVCDGTRKGIFTDKNRAIANAKSMFYHEKEYYHIAVVDLSTGKEVWSWSAPERDKELDEHIVKHGSGYRLVSKKSGKNLGDFPSKAAAQKHEREVEYFKHANEEEQLDELTFKGSPCTKDCSGHRAGYEWSRRKGGQDAASWSRSFNNGAALFKNGF